MQLARSLPPSPAPPMAVSSCAGFPLPSFLRSSACLSPRIRCTAGQVSTSTSSPQFDSIDQFVRFRKLGTGGEGDLQTSVVSFTERLPRSPGRPALQVDLVSNTHIGETQYFDTLKTVFESYDCILHEVVIPKEFLENCHNGINARRVNAASLKMSGSIDGFFQNQFASIYSLDHLQNHIDWYNEKWVHADLDSETFYALMIERGETTLFPVFSLFNYEDELRMHVPEHLDSLTSYLVWASYDLLMPLLGRLVIRSLWEPLDDQLAEYLESDRSVDFVNANRLLWAKLLKSDIKVAKIPDLEALSRLDFCYALRSSAAKMLTSGVQLPFDEEKSVLIGERNRVALKVLRSAIDSGKTRIAVFYGGGHMPSFSKSLQDEFDLVPCSVNWLTAWSVRFQKLDNDSPSFKALAQMLRWPLDGKETLALLLFSLVGILDLCLWALVIRGIAAFLGFLPKLASTNSWQSCISWLLAKFGSVAV